MRRVDKIFVIAMVLVFIYWMLLLINPTITSPLTQLFEWMTDGAVVLGYPGTFLVSLLGSAMVIVEVPFAVVPFLLGGLREGVTGTFLFNPWAVGIISGIGATLGDMTSYVLGYAGRRIIDESNTSGFSKFITKYPRATPLAILILASTPLPLDPAVVALGIGKYSWWKLFWSCLIGEITFLVIVAWAGRLSLDWFLGVLGIGGPITPLSATVEVLGITLLVIIVYLTVRLDWIALARKLRHSEDMNAK